MRRTLPWMALAATLVAVLVSWRWMHGENELSLPLKISVKADIEMRGISFFHHDRDGMRLRLKANKIRYYDEKRLVTMESINATLYGREGGSVAIVADTGEYSIPRRIVHLEGRVLLVTPQGDHLSTQELTLDQRRMVLESHSPVVFQRSGLILRGEGFRYDFRRGKLVVDQQKSVIKGEEIQG